jgi:hypothetical protein
MFIRNGKKISIDLDLTIGEGDDAITYPAGSLKSAELRAELGIVEVADPVRPDDRLHYVTENEDGSFTATPRPIGQVTASVWERIKAERDRRTQAGGYLVSGKWYHSDTFSRTQQMGLVLLGANIPAGTQWKTMDGSFVAMTPALAAQIFAGAAANDIAIFAAAEAHKAAMEASAEPLAYDFTAGWPATFGEQA